MTDEYYHSLKESVSMPLVGLYPFLPSEEQKKFSPKKAGVNALSRALSISTVSPKKPCKIKVCEARFYALFAEYSENVQIQPFRNGFLYPLVIILSTWFPAFLRR